MNVSISDLALFQLFSFTGLAFLVSLAITPLLTNFLYKNKLGKRIRQTDYAGESAPIYSRMHRGKENTPTMGGVLIWLTVAIITLLFNLSRAGTWLPLFALVASGIIGGLDDLYNIRGIGPNRGGIRFRDKFFLYFLIAAFGAWWFYFKLGWSIIRIPMLGNFEISFWYIPLFIFVIVFLAFAVNETDGLDGLAGGTLAIAFAAYAFIALTQGKTELAIFCATIIGALLAFLWFNIYPARFFMGDTGAMALGTTLGVVAFLTNSVAVLPIIGLVFFIEAGSVIIQIFSKRVFQRKVFLSSPIHHHLEAIGWPETKVTMRFWLLTAVSATIGLALALFK